MGGRVPPRPPEMRQGHVASPRALVAFHEVVRLGGFVEVERFFGFG